MSSDDQHHDDNSNDGNDGNDNSMGTSNDISSDISTQEEPQSAIQLAFRRSSSARLMVELRKQATLAQLRRTAPLLMGGINVITTDSGSNYHQLRDFSSKSQGRTAVGGATGSLSRRNAGPNGSHVLGEVSAPHNDTALLSPPSSSTRRPAFNFPTSTITSSNAFSTATSSAITDHHDHPHTTNTVNLLSSLFDNDEMYRSAKVVPAIAAVTDERSRARLERLNKRRLQKQMENPGKATLLPLMNTDSNNDYYQSLRVPNFKRSPAPGHHKLQIQNDATQQPTSLALHTNLKPQVSRDLTLNTVSTTLISEPSIPLQQPKQQHPTTNWNQKDHTTILRLDGVSENHASRTDDKAKIDPSSYHGPPRSLTLENDSEKRISILSCDGSIHWEHADDMLPPPPFSRVSVPKLQRFAGFRGIPEADSSPQSHDTYMSHPSVVTDDDDDEDIITIVSTPAVIPPPGRLPEPPSQPTSLQLPIGGNAKPKLRNDNTTNNDKQIDRSDKNESAINIASTDTAVEEIEKQAQQQQQPEKEYDSIDIIPGKICPSKYAYHTMIRSDAKDTFDMENLGVQSIRQNQSSADKKSFEITYAHTLDYKGEIVWECSTKCTGDALSNFGTTTTCCLLLADRAFRIHQLFKQRTWLANFENDIHNRYECKVRHILHRSAKMYFQEHMHGNRPIPSNPSNVITVGDNSILVSPGNMSVGGQTAGTRPRISNYSRESLISGPFQLCPVPEDDDEIYDLAFIE